MHHKHITLQCSTDDEVAKRVCISRKRQVRPIGVSVPLALCRKTLAAFRAYTSRKTWFLQPFIRLLPQSDLTRHYDRAFASRVLVIISGQVKRCQKLVRRLEVSGFPAKHIHEKRLYIGFTLVTTRS